MSEEDLMPFALCLVSGVVKYASCTCVAGSVGFCNHVLAVMMKLCNFSFASITEQDLADMGLIVGQKIMLWRVLSLLGQDGAGSCKGSSAWIQFGRGNL